MPTTPILGITQVSPSQNSKETTINDAILALENATNRKFTLDFTAGVTKTLTATEATRNFMFVATNASAAATVNFPVAVNGNPFSRLFVVNNKSGQALTVKFAAGAGTQVVVPNNQARLIAATDGTDMVVAVQPQSAVSFVSLADVPNTFTGQAGKFLTANEAENALEFVEAAVFPSYVNRAGRVLTVNTGEDGVEWKTLDFASDFLDLDDVPNSYSGQANKLVAVKSAGNGLEFIDPPEIEAVEFAASDKWRIRVLVPGSETQTGFGEIELLDVNGLDRTGSGTATATNEEAGKEIGLAFDNNLDAGNGWLTEDGYSDEITVEYDFGTPEVIRSVRLHPITGLPTFTPLRVAFDFWNGDSWVEVGDRVADAWEEATPQTFKINGVPLSSITDAPSDGEQYVRRNGGWETVAIPDPLPDLTDNEGKHLAVNAAGDDVEWVDSFALPAITDNEGKVLAVNAAGDDVEWIDPPEGGGSGDASYPAFTNNAGKHLAVNAAEDGVEWVTPAEGGDNGAVTGFGAHRYWRIYIAANNGMSSFTTATGVELRDENGDNCVGSGTAIAASFSSANSAPQYAFNPWFSDAADSGNYWSSASGQAAPTWIGYDFGDGNAFDIRSFTMTGVRENIRMPQIMVLQYSDDGIAWKTGQAFDPAVGWQIGGTDTREFVVTTGLNTGGGGGGGGSSGPVEVGAHRYWRLSDLKAGESSFHGFAEIAFRAAAGGTKHAIASVSASNESFGTAANAVDGNPNTWWATTNGQFPYTFDVDFGTAQVVGNVAVTARNDAGYSLRTTHGFELSYSDDGVVYTPLVQINLKPFTVSGATKSADVPTVIQTGVINNGGGGTPPTLVQQATLRGDGDLTLPNAPTEGNLLVVVMAGYRNPNLITEYMPAGFTPGDLYNADTNNAVAVATRRVVAGDPAVWALSASDNQSAVMYEFEGASAVMGIAGGAMSRLFTGNDFEITLPRPIFAGASVVLTGFTSDNTPDWIIDPKAGLVVDYTTPPSGSVNHPGAYVRYDYSFDGAVTGNLTGSSAWPAFGAFEVIGKPGFGGGGGSGGSGPTTVEEVEDIVNNLLAGDASKYLRFTATTAKIVNVRTEAVHPLPENGEWNLYNEGVGNLTVVPASGVTINAPAGGSLVIPPRGVATLKRVAEDVFDLLGATLGASLSGTPYSVPMGFVKKPESNEVMLIHVFAEAVNFDPAWAGSAYDVGTNPAVNKVFNVRKNGVNVGAATFNTDGTVTFSTSSNAAVSYAVGDVMRIVAPPLADTALADAAITLKGTRV